MPIWRVPNQRNDEMPSRKPAPVLLKKPLIITLNAPFLESLNAYREAKHAEQWPPLGQTVYQQSEYREEQRVAALRAAVELSDLVSEWADSQRT